MPLYDYKCREHGLFHELVMLSDSDRPQPCPQCSSLSARVIVLPAAILGLDSTHKAIARNERSQHEPLFSTPEQRLEAQAKQRHDRGCGCQTCHDPALSPPKALYTADGKKWFPATRPWMISH